MARSLYYVSPASGNDTTGDGTSGTPWATVQKALDTITRNSTDGDQINLQAGGTNTLAGSLSLTTYGTPTQTASLIIRGYTTTANDGGVGIISGGAGGFAIFASAYNSIHLIDLRLTNTGAAHLINLGTTCSVIRCEVDTNTQSDGYGISFASGGVAAGCYVHDTRGYGIVFQSDGLAVGNYVKDGASYDLNQGAIVGTAQRGITIVNNVVSLQRAGSRGIYLYRCQPGLVMNNTIYQSAAGTLQGIYSATVESYQLVIANNIISGFSGTGGKGIHLDDKNGALVVGNALYNNTTGTLYDREVIADLGNTDTLTGLPYVDAASGDFDINGTVAGVTEDAWPSSFLGLASTSPKADKGAVQAGAGAGGVLRRVMRVLGG